MTDFYVTLPSHSSKNEFPDNKASSFKIRLPHPIRLEGEGWKVGLASVSMPDPISKAPDLSKSQYAYLFKAYWLASWSGQPDKVFNATFEPRDIREDTSYMTGMRFMNLMQSFFEKKRIEKVLLPGWKIADADGKNHTYPHFEWRGDDFVLHNDDVRLKKVGNQYYPAFYINAPFAEAMGWFVQGNGVYELGPNLVIELPLGRIPTPSDTDSSRPVNTFWKYGSVSRFIGLSMTCNWRFINLKASFKNIINTSKRPLLVYSDVGGSGVVGNQVTDLLREVSYKREGKGNQYFEPLHIQYIPVRKKVLDIIETEVAEASGDLAQLGEGNTIVTLHFQQT